MVPAAWNAPERALAADSDLPGGVRKNVWKFSECEWISGQTHGFMCLYARRVPQGETQMATTTKNANRRLTPGTQVVSKTDGEPGRIERVSTYRRNGIDAWSYEVATAYGREIWDAGDLFVPEKD